MLIDGLAVGIFTPSGTSYQTYTTAPFTVTAGSHTITFQGLDSAGGDNTALIDQIVVVEAAGPPSIGDRISSRHTPGRAGTSIRSSPTRPNSSWSFSGKAGVAANGSGYTQGSPPAPEGTQVAFLQMTGSFSQVVTAWAGGSYQITFKAAQRSTDLCPQRSSRTSRCSSTGPW